jgi:carboxylesterase
MIAVLRREGLEVSGPVLPGHEENGPTMPGSRWTDWATAAEAAFDELARMGRSIAVIGFSTGATTALYLASRRPAARMVLLAPFLAIRYTRLIPLRPATIISRLSRLIPNLPRRPPAVRDPVMRRQAAKATQYRTFNLQAAQSALELIDEVKPLVPEITTPTLILQGRLDTVVEPAGASWLYENLGASEKSLIILPHSDHLIALDRDRDQAIKASLDFLLARGGSGNRKPTV